MDSEDELIAQVFPNLQEKIRDENWLCINETVTKINNKILDKITSETSVYNSIDTVMSSDDTTSYPIEFLNSLELSGVPSHKPRYQSLVGGSEPLQSYLHKRLPENLNSEAALGTVGDVAQCVQWLRSTFLFVRAARDPKRYLSLPQNSPQHLISKKIEELCVKAMNGLASSGLITMDEASCIESTEAGRLMSIFYLDLETMKHIMKIEGSESLERLLWLICESHELADMHLRMDERRCLNALNRNNSAPTIRYPMKGKITTRQMKLNCVIQAILGCLPIPDPSLGQEAMKIMRIADRVCKCLVAYVIRPNVMSHQPQFYSAVLNTLILAKCIAAHLWENSPYLSKQLKGIGPTFSTLLATAGKTNFMLLEESHPRDLERIMNKGPPAGNMIRKQISLLPKYQLTITPVDERTISLELVLLNQSFLSESMDNLTAGEHHKSYIVVGDSSNHLLLLTSFKDKDLISIYDGTIKYELKRKNDTEHKVFAHCISSTFVGIDAHAEYSFNDLDHLLPRIHPILNENLPIKNTTKKQTCITDTFKERKRKNTNDITQSKEKRKRDIAVIEKFKSLKESFGFCTKEVKVHANDVQQKTDNTFNEDVLTNLVELTEKNTVPVNSNYKDLNELHVNVHDIDNEEYIDNAQIDSILRDIENEIAEVKSNTNNSVETIDVNNIRSRNATKTTPIKINEQDGLKLCTKRKTKLLTNKTNNYKFIDLLEKNLDLCEDDEKFVEAPKHNGFSETIKSHINKYLQNTENKTKLPDSNIKNLLDDTDKTNKKELEKVDSEELLTELSNNFKCSGPDVQYQVTEILEPIGPIKKVNVTEQEVRYNKMLGTETINIVNTEDDELDKDSTHTDTFNNNLHTVRKQVDSEAILTEISTIMEQPTNTSVPSENNEINEYVTPVKQSNEDIHDKDKIIDFDVINITNTENERHDWINVDLCSSKDNTYTYAPHEIAALMLYNQTNDLVDASEKDVTYGMHDNRLTEMKVPSTATIPCHNNVTKKDYTVVPVGHFENKTIQHNNKEIFPKSVYNLNVEERCDKSHKRNLPLKRFYDKQPKELTGPSYTKYSYNNTVNNATSPISILSQNNFDEIKESVNNYSFSAIKINTCTKDSMKIVRKVRVDLNISETISLEKIGNISDKKYEQKDQTKCVQSLKRTPEHYTVPGKESKKIIWKKEIEPRNDYIEIPLQHEVNALKYGFANLKNNNDLKESTFVEEIQDVVKVNKVNTFQLHSDSKDDVIGTKPLKLQSLEDRNKDSEYVSRELKPKPVNSKIKSILEKYSNILGQNSIKPLPPILSNTNEDRISSKKSSEVKLNRPFKISEIHQLQAQLPKSLMDDKPHSNNIIIPKNEINVAIPKYNNEEPNPQHNQCIKDNVNIEILEYQYSNLEALDVPVDVEFEPSKDFNIDNSMLDPKTLLHSTVECDIDEIIPPPQQFCDETDFSPDNVHEIRVSENYCNQWYTDSENDVTVDIATVGYDDNGNESIFKDSCDEQLTPSKEIETWTLSRQDSWEKLASNPVKSFTVMRKNTPDDDAFDSTLPRRVRLDKFHFNHKDKFKIRR